MSINVLFVVNVFNTRQGAVNKIKCCDYQATYISETGGNWPNTSERHARNGDVQTANHIAEHYSQTKHQIDWNAATCITYSADYYQRLALESWFTNSEKNATDSQSTVTDTVQTTHWRTQAKLTTREWLDNRQFDQRTTTLLTVTIDRSKRTNKITSLYSQ